MPKFMSARVNIRAAALLLLSAIVLAAPAIVRAQSGGVAPSGGASASGPGTSGTPQVASAGATISASGNGISLLTRASAILRKPLRFSGNAGRSAAGDTVEIERRGRQTHGVWAPTTHGIARADGSFSAVWPTNHIGQFAIRAVVERGHGARAAGASPSLTITVYRPAIATIYGPGLYGRHTACGQTLRPDTVGVANRTLRCGTRVAALYRGRTIVVPVIDRGPYAHDADWDLTAATARALGVAGTARIAAVSLPGGR